mmetsp:Transcript_11425/g.26879  ORF Transcript_11425/g.26879 Transcript_11425/m.26879 type:complete len:224 (-) Transcript_11425:248-919(-)
MSNSRGVAPAAFSTFGPKGANVSAEASCTSSSARTTPGCGGSAAAARCMLELWCLSLRTSAALPASPVATIRSAKNRTSGSLPFCTASISGVCSASGAKSNAAADSGATRARSSSAIRRARAWGSSCFLRECTLPDTAKCRQFQRCFPATAMMSQPASANFTAILTAQLSTAASRAVWPPAPCSALPCSALPCPLLDGVVARCCRSTLPAPPAKRSGSVSGVA